MATAKLEHANITVSDPKATAAELCELFGWQVRWQGAAISGGQSIHVGDDASYLALYTPPSGLHDATGSSYTTRAGLNHIGIVVDDLDATEARIKAAGYQTKNHADYEPGRRFYFDNADGIEIEVVSYP